METEKFRYPEIEKIVYIWGRYEGTRDDSIDGKFYDKSDLKELAERINRFIENPKSFVEGIEFDDDYQQCEFCGRFFKDLEKHKNKVHGGKEQQKL